MELSDRWGVEYRIERSDNPKISKVIVLVIKNKSVYERRFKVYLKKATFKNEVNYLRFMMYSGLNNPIEITIGRYSKKEVSINVPLFPIIDEGKLIIGVINLDKNEEKELEINV